MGLFDAFDSSSGERAAAQKKAALTEAAGKGFDEKKKFLQKGTRQQVGSLREGLAPFEQIYGQEQQGRQAYMDALGLGTPEDTAAARARFMASPGYQYQLEQGNQSVLRNQASAGGLRSGATGMDLQNYSQNLANQDWGNWLNRLGGFDPYQSAQGRAGLLTNIGNAYGQQGVNLANAAGSKFDALGNAKAGYAGDVYGAQQGANQNAWNLIGGVASGGANLAGNYLSRPITNMNFG